MAAFTIPEWLPAHVVGRDLGGPNADLGRSRGGDRWRLGRLDLTAVISFVLHKKGLAHERRLARQKVDWDFLSTTLPVLSRLFSSTTPDRLKTEDDVFLMLDDAYASLREGTFRGIFSGSAHTEPISSNVYSYSEALKKYVRREMSREHLEQHRKRALDEVSAHWKKLLPDAAGR